eukprot:Lankesteria_metandrocarpae@DN3745_c0_g1_i1.p1
MPKAEVGTPKWLANKMKAKGLQRLRWWCEMCQKQCRDENGFKCHRMSEQHQRQMKLFASTPDRYMDSFSKEFERTFMRLMQTTYCRTRVLANTVYCDLISEKTHTHMNSTVWVTLSEFVQYLGRTGKCTIDRTERGWWLEYIDKDKVERDKAAERERKAELNEEQRRARFLQEAVEKGKREQAKKDLLRGAAAETEDTAVGNVCFKMSQVGSDTRTIDSASVPVKRAAPLPFGDAGEDELKNVVPTKTKPTSMIDKLMEERSKRRKTIDDGHDSHDQQKQYNSSLNSDVSVATEPRNGNSDCDAQQQEDDDGDDDDDVPWLSEGIVVRVVDKKLPKVYFKQKGIVTKVTDRFLATVKILMVNKTIQIDQSNLDPVLPACGGAVLIVRGEYRGLNTVIREVDVENNAVLVDDPLTSSKNIIRVQFEDVCKLHAA